MSDNESIILKELMDVNRRLGAMEDGMVTGRERNRNDINDVKQEIKSINAEMKNINSRMDGMERSSKRLLDWLMSKKWFVSGFIAALIMFLLVVNWLVERWNAIRALF